MKLLKRLLLAVLVLLLFSELVARFYFGLGEVPVYIEDPGYEYIYAPSQDVKRFGNRIITNSFSMRSEEIDTSAVTILGFGDSVINGGSQTDHDSLATTLLSKELTTMLKRKVQVLNISANSWGPDNEYAYLEKHGNFNSSLIVLFVSSHDLFDNRHFKKVVGVHPAWPDQQPCCALSDGIFKYAVPMFRSKFESDYDSYSYLGISTTNKIRNTGFDSFFRYSKEKNIPLIVYLHPTKAEAQSGAYDDSGKKIISILDSADVKYINPLPHFKDPDLYRDFIHLSPQGQSQMTEILVPLIRQYLR